DRPRSLLPGGSRGRAADAPVRGAPGLSEAPCRAPRRRPPYAASIGGHRAARGRAEPPGGDRGIAAEARRALHRRAGPARRAGGGGGGRVAGDSLDMGGEIAGLAQLYRDAATWFEEQEMGYPVADHADELFVDLTFRQPAQQFRERAERLDEGAFDSGWPRPQDLLEEYERLANRFRAEVSSFERKRFVSLSHEPNKAMNLNSYLGLIG